MTPGTVAGFALVLFGLTATIGWELVAQGSQTSGSPARPGPVVNHASRNSVTYLAGEVDQRLKEILARPVLSRDRRPTGSATHSVAGLARLSGIVFSGTHKIAIFAASSGGPPVIVEEGARLNAYQVTAITKTDVTVVGPNGIAVLRPAFDSAAPLPVRLIPAHAAPLGPVKK